MTRIELTVLYELFKQDAVIIRTFHFNEERHHGLVVEK